MKLNILIIEDDESLREVLRFHLEDSGHVVDVARDGVEGVKSYEPARHDVVLTDLNMPRKDGMQVLAEIRHADPRAVVMVLTAYGSTDRAVDAMRAGAFHYVEKPVNRSTLLAMVERAGSHRRVQRENARLKGEDHPIVTGSVAMNQVLHIVDKVADSDATVLIHGESGTGKELVARAIHTRSMRRDQPFIAVNCAAIPDELLESTLFGHERGAFTGATKSTKGKFVAANGGTLFLDEIAEMSPRLQSKLLRVLQEGEVETVGATQPQPVDVRVVAATHQDLGLRIANGEFREDLFYRLNVIPLELPALRDRREDIPVLTRFFIRKHAAGQDIRIAPEVDDRLVEHRWTGNVRELENVVKRMLLLRNAEVLTESDLPPEIAKTSALPHSAALGLPFELPEDSLDLIALEKAVIVAALDKHDGNQSATARYLKIPRHVLLYRIEKYELSEHEKETS